MALPTSKISPLGNYAQQPNQVYITTKPFNGKVFTYSTYVDSNFVTQGTLAANSAYSTTANSPAGRILHANGKFLLPNVNPGVSKYYLGVLDPATGNKGFIDPSDSAFAKYDANLPVQYDLGTQAAVPPLGGQGAKLQVGPATPPAVICTVTTNTTSGTERNLNVTAVAQGTIKVGAVIVATGVPAGSIIESFLSGTGGTGTYRISADMTAPASGVACLMSGVAFSGGNQLAGDASVGQFVMDGATTATVNTSACTSSSLVLLTQVAGTNTSAPLVSAANGSFTITNSPAIADGVFNFLIVN